MFHFIPDSFWLLRLIKIFVNLVSRITVIDSSFLERGISSKKHLDCKDYFSRCIQNTTIGMLFVAARVAIISCTFSSNLCTPFETMLPIILWLMFLSRDENMISGRPGGSISVFILVFLLIWANAVYGNRVFFNVENAYYRVMRGYELVNLLESHRKQGSEGETKQNKRAFFVSTS